MTDMSFLLTLAHLSAQSTRTTTRETIKELFGMLSLLISSVTTGFSPARVVLDSALLPTTIAEVI
jgi:hypothetical protein